MESNDCVNLSVRKKSLELKNKNDDGIIKHHGNQNWFTGSIIDMQCNKTAVTVLPDNSGL